MMNGWDEIYCSSRLRECVVVGGVFPPESASRTTMIDSKGMIVHLLGW